MPLDRGSSGTALKEKMSTHTVPMEPTQAIDVPSTIGLPQKQMRRKGRQRAQEGRRDLSFTRRYLGVLA